MAQGPARDASGSAARGRLRLALLIAAVVLTCGSLYLVSARYGGRDEQKELHSYFKRTFPRLHARVKSAQAGLAGLVNETAPSAKGAVSILDEEIVPTIDDIIAEARPIAPEGIDARVLHAAYLQALDGMRADALRMRALFADPALGLGEQRTRSAEILAEIGARFEAFYARAAEVCKQHGIDLQP
jgi:hypothetical protein